MKKISLAGLVTGLFFIGTVGVANATLFTDTQSLNVTIGEGPVAQFFYGDTFSYTHNTPADFEVPWDTVNSAALSIAGYWINDNNDTVAVEGTVVGTLTPGGSYGLSWANWSWTYSDTPSISNFDITSTFSTWNTGTPLTVSITADGAFGDYILELDTSTFTLDYDNGAAPVPEPATMLLFGTGLIGLIGYSRKRGQKS